MMLAKYNNSAIFSLKNSGDFLNHLKAYQNFSASKHNMTVTSCSLGAYTMHNMTGSYEKIYSQLDMLK